MVMRNAIMLLCFVFVFSGCTMFKSLGLGGEGLKASDWDVYVAQIKQVHKDVAVMGGARTLKETAGEKCVAALEDFYKIDINFLVLQDSPVFDFKGLRGKNAIMIEGVLHVRPGVVFDHYAHEFRHVLQQRTMGIAFYPAYALAHTVQDYSGNIFELQAREAQRAFDLNYGPVCVEGE